MGLSEFNVGKGASSTCLVHCDGKGASSTCLVHCDGEGASSTCLVHCYGATLGLDRVLVNS